MTEPARRFSLRPASLKDLPQINRLLQLVWFAPRSAEGFDWLCRRNPGQSGLPAGWVLEKADGHVGAFLGNFVQHAWHRGEAHLIASGHSFVAAPGQGGRALGLLRTFMRQPEPAILTGLNANAVSGRLYQAMRLSSYPDTGALKLSWVTNPLVAAFGALSWRAHGLAGQRFIRRVPDQPRPQPQVDSILENLNGNIRRIAAPMRDPHLSDFDAALRNGSRLFTERSPVALHWRLSDPDATVPPVLLAYPSTGAIRGLGLFQFNEPSEAEPPYLDVIDLVTPDAEDSEAAQGLVQAGLELAKRTGMARLRLSMVTPALIRLLGPFGERARKTSGETPHAFYKAKAGLPGPIDTLWQPVPYDGDKGPSLRAMPVRPA
jgi:hypothetical protein